MERRRERLAKYRRVHKRRVVHASTVGATVAVLAQVAFLSPLLALRLGGVAVHGTGAAGVADNGVKAAVAEYAGAPLIRLSMGEVELKAHRSLSVTKWAKVTQDSPGGVTTAVTLRKPVACMVEKASCMAIDEDGAHLDVPKSRTSSFLKLKLADSDTLRAMSIMGAVSSALNKGMRGQVASVWVMRAGQTAFILSDGATVN